ncbi:MAG TPA: hypothetical protein VFB58_13260 [Chloroflexota bacterium]|nr:hypothetical protein [Chloroflexota bacterium]
MSQEQHENYDDGQLKPVDGEFDVTGGPKVDTETERLQKAGVRTPVGPQSADDDLGTVLTTGNDMGTADDQGGSTA